MAKDKNQKKAGFRKQRQKVKLAKIQKKEDSATAKIINPKKNIASINQFFVILTPVTFFVAHFGLLFSQVGVHFYLNTYFF